MRVRGAMMSRIVAKDGASAEAVGVMPPDRACTPLKVAATDSDPTVRQAAVTAQWGGAWMPQTLALPCEAVRRSDLRDAAIAAASRNSAAASSADAAIEN